MWLHGPTDLDKQNKYDGIPISTTETGTPSAQQIRIENSLKESNLQTLKRDSEL